MGDEQACENLPSLRCEKRQAWAWDECERILAEVTDSAPEAVMGLVTLRSALFIVSLVEISIRKIIEDGNGSVQCTV